MAYLVAHRPSGRRGRPVPAGTIDRGDDPVEIRVLRDEIRCDSAEIRRRRHVDTVPVDPRRTLLRWVMSGGSMT